MITYLGLASEPVIVGGSAGPETYSAPEGGALAILSIKPFSEGDHARLVGVANAWNHGGAVAPSTTGGKVAHLIDAIESALANDGTVDAGEARELLVDAVSAFGGDQAAAYLSGAVSVGETVASLLSTIRGK